MPIKTSILERALFYQLNLAPSPLLDLAGAISYQTLATAAQLDIFQALQRRPLTAAELAQKINAQERGIQALLNALKAIGYVDKDGDRYSNTTAVEKWLLADDLIDIKAATTYWSAVMLELWPHSADIIRSGKRPFAFYEWLEESPELAAAFQKFTGTNVTLVGPDIVKKLELPSTAEKLLDVGGGHGMFSVIFCQHHPHLTATVLDSAQALVTAQSYVDKHQMNSRVRLRPGDLWQLDWGQGYDIVLLFNLLHHFDLETNTKLLQTAATALKPGGQVAILEQVEGKVSGAATNAFVQLIALLYHLAVDGRVYSQDELRTLLGRTGFVNERFHSLAKSPGTTLVTAVKV